MGLQIIECDQGSDAWFAARMGIPTSSKFATVMAKGQGKTRSDYMRKLAGEILTGQPMEHYSNQDMERGHEQEPEARKLYAFMHDCEPQIVGFIRNGNKGGSPDSLIGKDGGLEIKSAAAHVQVERLLLNRVPPEHVAQVQGNIWIAEREWWDFVSYCPKLPLLTVRAYRDEDYIKKLATAVDEFNDELAHTVELVRRYETQSQLEAA
jgi:hypothetical protein